MQNGGRKGEKFRGGEGEAENIPERPKKITEGGGNMLIEGKYVGEWRKRLFCFEKFIAKFACGKFRKRQGRQRPEAFSQSIH